MSKPLDLTLKLMLGGCVILLPLTFAFIGSVLVLSNAVGRMDQTASDFDSIKSAFDANREIAAERTQAARLMVKFGVSEPIETVRDRVDRAVSRLVFLDRTIGGQGEDASFTVSLGRLRADLLKARGELDELRQAGRDVPTSVLNRVLNDFHEASDAAREASERIVVRVGARHSAAAPPAMTAMTLNDLSSAILETGLAVVPILSMRQPLSDHDRDAYARLRERMTDLWQLTLRDLSMEGEAPALMSVRNQVTAHVWHDTVDVIDRAFEIGRMSGDFRVGAADLLDASDANVTLIDRLRTVMLDQSIQKLLAQRGEIALWRTLCAGFFLFALIAAVVVMSLVWRRVIQPLFVAGQKIKSLARLEPVGAIMSPTGQPEIATIFEAVEDLFIVLEERAEHTQQLKQLAETDGLTGLLNRRLLDRIGDGAVEFDHLPRAVSVILMDLDRFKSVNDTFGHTSGDLVLRHAARLAQRACRKSDLVARYGGEEIAILIFDQDPWVAPHVAERIRSELEAMPVRLEDGRMLTVTASFGVAHGRRGGPQWLDVLNGADEALYRAKANGRNCVCGHQNKEPGQGARRVA